MKKIVDWNIGYIESLVPKMKQLLEEEFEEFNNFNDEGYPVINESDIFDRLAETVLEQEELDGIIASDDFEDFSELLWIEFNKKVPNYFEDIKSELREQWKDNEEYTRNPLGYVGMSTRDFL
jgi:hypothetical protein